MALSPRRLLYCAMAWGASVFAACGSPPPAGLANDVRLVPVSGERAELMVPADGKSGTRPKRDAERRQRVAAECYGNGLDLGELNRFKSCVGPKKCSAFDSSDCSPVEHAPAASELGIQVVPETQQVKPGAEIRFRVELENLAPGPLLLDVDSTCGVAVSFDAELRADTGTPARYVGDDGKASDLPPAGCDTSGIMFGCDGEAMRIELAPSGKAAVHLKVDGHLLGMVDGQCTEVPLPRGSYRLQVATPFVESDQPRVATATVEIQ